MDVVKFLIEQGAKVDHAGSMGDTSLAITSKVLLFCFALLCFCFCLSHNLTRCFQYGLLKFVEFLVEKGATVDLVDNCDRTPLFRASEV